MYGVYTLPCLGVATDCYMELRRRVDRRYDASKALSSSVRPDSLLTCLPVDVQLKVAAAVDSVLLSLQCSPAYRLHQVALLARDIAGPVNQHNRQQGSRLAAGCQKNHTTSHASTATAPA